jgi:hypothetical protein
LVECGNETRLLRDRKDGLFNAPCDGFDIHVGNELGSWVAPGEGTRPSQCFGNHTGCEAGCSSVVAAALGRLNHRMRTT